MGLLPKSIWIFIGLLLMLLIAAMYPTPTVVMLAMLFGCGLVIWQVMLVLKDEA